MNPPSTPRTLPRLTSLRVFAAAAVFAYHLWLFNVVTFLSPARIGYAGVGFFFLLSGFVLSWSTSVTLPATTFWRRRLARIYPATVLLIAVTLFVPYGGSVHPVVFIACLLLVQAWSTSLGTTVATNPVTWSLSCEAFFYLLLPAVLRQAARVRLRVVAAGAIGYFVVASTIVAAFAWKSSRHPSLALIAYSDPAVRFGEFLLGVALAIAMRRGWRPPTKWCAGMILVGLLATAALPRTAPLPDVWLAPAWLGIIGLAVNRDVDHPDGVLAHPFLVYAGEVSFCFYLVHQLIMRNVQHMVGHGGVGVALLILALASVAAEPA